MLVLETGEVLSGKAGTAAAITWTLHLDNPVTSTDTFKKPQGVLGAATATMFTAPGTGPSLIREITFVNTGVTNVTGITLYMGGTGTGNQVLVFAIPAGGSATFDGHLEVKDASGALQTTGSTGPSSTLVIGTTSTLVPGSAATAGNSGTPTAVILDLGIPAGSVIRNGAGAPSNGLGVNGDYYINTTTWDLYFKSSGTYSVILNIRGGQGIPGVPGVVQTVGYDATILPHTGNTAADPKFKRAPITGDIGIPDGSNVATLPNVNAGVGSFGSATQVPVVTTNAKGQITAAAQTAIQIAESQVTNLVADLAAKADDSLVVHKAGVETVAGMKTFTPGLKITAQVSPAHETGKLAFDSVEDALIWFNSDSALTLNIGFETWIKVKNTTGSTIANGAAVYTNGADTGLPTVALAKANAFGTVQCSGITTQSIVNGAIGIVTTQGVVHNLNTLSFPVGSIVYVSETTAGALTITSPVGTNFAQRVGVVRVSSATVGEILVDRMETVDVATYLKQGLLTAKDFTRIRREWDAWADFGIVSDLRTAYELPAAGTQQVIANGGTTVTIPNIAAGGTPFTSTAVDAGKRITVNDPAGGAPYVGTIVSITNSSTAVVSPAHGGATITANATGTVYVFVQWGTDNTAAAAGMVSTINAQIYPTPKICFGKYANPDWTNSPGFPTRLPFTKVVSFEGVGGGHTADVGDYTKIGGTRIAWWGTSHDGGVNFGAFITVEPPAGGASTVAFVQSNTVASGSGTPNAVALLLGLVTPGNMLIATVSVPNSGTVTTVPSGWTQLATNLSGALRTYVYFKPAGAGEPSTWTWATTQTSNTVSVTEYSGVNTSLVPVFGYFGNAGLATIASPVINTVVANSLIHQSVCNNVTLNSGLTNTPPGTVTEDSEAINAVGVANNTGGSHDHDTTNQAAVGATTARTFTWASAPTDGGCYTIALAPNTGAFIPAIKRPRFSSCWIDCRNGDQNQALYGLKMSSVHGAMLDEGFFVMDALAQGIWMNISTSPAEAKDSTRFDFNRLCFRQLDNTQGATLTPTTTSTAITLTATGQVLTLASVVGFKAAGGYAIVNTTSGRRHVIKYASVSGSTLTGCVVAAEEVIHTPTTYANAFIVPCTPGNGGAMKLDGGSGANTSVGKVSQVQISMGETWGLPGIDLGNSDSIGFDWVIINGGNNTIEANGNRNRRPGAMVAGSIVSNTLAARNHTFDNCDFGGSPSGPKGALVCLGVNHLGALLPFSSGPTYNRLQQMGNGTPVPTAELGASLSWDGNGLLREGGLNRLTAAQALTGNVANVVNGCHVVMPPQGWQVGTELEWLVELSRTAGVGTSWTVNIRQHSSLTAGGGTLIATAVFTATSVVDSGTMRINLVCTNITTPSAAVALARYELSHQLLNNAGLSSAAVNPVTSPSPPAITHNDVRGPMTMATFNKDAPAGGPTFVFLEILPTTATHAITVSPPSGLVCVKAALP